MLERFLIPISRSADFKIAPLVVLSIITLVTGALAFLPGNAGDTVADNILGQPDFVHSVPNVPNSRSLNTFNNIGHVAIDQSGRVYVADAGNNRVLGYSRTGPGDTVRGLRSRSQCGMGQRRHGS